MEDSADFLKAFQTVLQMAQDRGYIVPSELFNETLDTFRTRYHNKNCDIVLKKKQPSRILYVKFIYSRKVKPNTIRELAENIQTEHLGKHSELIFVLKQKPNNSILKIKKEPQFQMCEFFWLDILQFNITKHKLVPQHQKISPKELKIIMSKYKLSHVNQLPRILQTDPIVQYYNFKRGDVIKITRPSPTAFRYVYYRTVV